MLKSSLCDYSNACILFKGTITYQAQQHPMQMQTMLIKK